MAISNTSGLIVLQLESGVGPGFLIWNVVTLSMLHNLLKQSPIFRKGVMPTFLSCED
jgi:hypothetical protein